MPTEELPIPAEQTNSPATAPKAVDLSAEIALTVAKQPGDRVRVSRVWGDHYRCNWLAPRNRLDNSLLESFHIRHSRFLKVTRTEDGKLTIQDMTAPN
jgi:hypothetical protein